MIDEGLSVRQTESLTNQAKTKGKREPRPGGVNASTRDADTVALERDLAAAIGASVRIDHGADGTGKLIINYKDLDGLDSICTKLGVCGID